nr:MAG TPA: hypothetical protein [Caudoviricetes sp.]
MEDFSYMWKPRLYRNLGLFFVLCKISRYPIL